MSSRLISLHGKANVIDLANCIRALMERGVQVRCRAHLISLLIQAQAQLTESPLLSAEEAENFLRSIHHTPATKRRGRRCQSI